MTQNTNKILPTTIKILAKYEIFPNTAKYNQSIRNIRPNTTKIQIKIVPKYYVPIFTLTLPNTT